MKFPACLLILLTAFAACRPHYDFSKERQTVRAEAKDDSLCYETDFSGNTNNWGGVLSTPGNSGGLILFVDSIGKVREALSPAGILRYDYAVSVNVRISVDDSTDTGYAGIIFDRIDSAYARTLFISNKGSFCLKDRYNGEEELLIPKISSRYLNKGRNAWNTIEIRHRRREIHLLFNGNLAAICKLNSAFSYGRVGLLVATADSRVGFSPVTASFRRFTLKKMRKPGS